MSVSGYGGAPHDTNWGEVKADLDKLEERLAGRECFGGLDLARVNDPSALVLVFPPQEIPTLDALATAGIVVQRFQGIPIAIGNPPNTA
jgi:phage terminase large subunit-like protein